MRALAALSCLVLLGGCSVAGEITGLVAGGASGGATGNPAIGYAVGVTTAAAADYAFAYVARVRQNAEQDAIAAAAASAPEGTQAPWRIRHDIPIGNEHGTVQVVRRVDTPLAQCREIVFSVLDDPPTPPAWYDASICREPDRWKWASAEPAVQRWGFLQ